MVVQKMELIQKLDDHGNDIVGRADAVIIGGNIALIKRMITKRR